MIILRSSFNNFFNRLADALLENLLDELACEMDSIFDLYAQKLLLAV